MLGPTALATQATRATPAWKPRLHAQRVSRASSKLLQALLIARTVAWASTGLLQDNPLKQRHAQRVRKASSDLLQEALIARPAARARTGPMKVENRALPAGMGSILLQQMP